MRLLARHAWPSPDEASSTPNTNTAPLQRDMPAATAEQLVLEMRAVQRKREEPLVLQSLSPVSDPARSARTRTLSGVHVPTYSRPRSSRRHHRDVIRSTSVPDIIAPPTDTTCSTARRPVSAEETQHDPDQRDSPAALVPSRPSSACSMPAAGATSPHGHAGGVPPEADAIAASTGRTAVSSPAPSLADDQPEDADAAPPPDTASDAVRGSRGSEQDVRLVQSLTFMHLYHPAPSALVDRHSLSPDPAPPNCPEDALPTIPAYPQLQHSANLHASALLSQLMAHGFVGRRIAPAPEQLPTSQPPLLHSPHPDASRAVPARPPMLPRSNSSTLSDYNPLDDNESVASAATKANRALRRRVSGQSDATELENSGRGSRCTAGDRDLDSGLLQDSDPLSVYHSTGGSEHGHCVPHLESLSASASAGKRAGRRRHDAVEMDADPAFLPVADTDPHLAHALLPITEHYPSSPTPSVRSAGASRPLSGDRTSAGDMVMRGGEGPTWKQAASWIAREVDCVVEGDVDEVFVVSHRNPSHTATPDAPAHIAAEPEGEAQKDSKEGKPRVVVEKLIGAGTSGRVYKACMEGKAVAVKRLSLQGLSHVVHDLARLEVHVLKSLHHPNLISYYGTAFCARTAHLDMVMEYVDGPSLSQHLATHGPLPESQVASILLQVLRGLHYLHSNRIIHRDLKPANILLTLDGQVKIIDLGVSVQLNNLTSLRKSCVGTPNYLAPEVICVEDYSYAADIWSVGCCALELLTGRRPYQHLNPVAAMYRMVNDSHPPLPRNSSNPCTAFLLQCWTRDWTQRPSAQDLLHHPFVLDAPPSLLL